MGLHLLEILSLQTLRCCRLGQVLKRNWLNFNIKVLHAMYILKNSYEKFWFMMCKYKKLLNLLFQVLLLLLSTPVCESTFLVLVEIKSK